MTTQTHTVKRNSREAREMWDNATRAISRTLGGYFEAVDVDVDQARAYYERTAANLKPSIRCDGPGRYVVRYHSNNWIELLCPPVASEVRDVA
jgi:hypothetical protein